MTTLIVPLYEYFNKEGKGFWNITRIAKERRLYFSDKDEFGGKIIALDNLKRKLFFLTKSHRRRSCLIVDLKDVVKCTIQKQYNSIMAGDLESRKLPEFLKTIFLCLRFKNSTCDIPIPFFEAQTNKQEEIQYLEAKAIEWKSIVTKCYQSG